MKFGIAPGAHHWGKFKRRFWGDYVRRLHLVGDAELTTLTLMEWMGRSRQPETINSEIDRLDDDHAFGAPQFGYLRLDLPLERAPLADLGINVTDEDLARFRRIDDPGIIRPIYDLAREVCARRYDLEQLLP